MNKKSLILAVISVSLVLVWLSPNQVKGAMGITITPTKIRLDLEKGTVNSQGKVTAINPNDFTIGVKTQVEDFVPSADTPGDIDIILKSEGVTSLVDWIEINKEIFTLEPGGRKTVPFQVRVPEDAEAGAHYAAIFFGAVPPEAQAGTIGIAGRVGCLVLGSVPGQVTRTGEIVEFKAPKLVNKGPVKFSVLFKNTGTVHYEPEGTIEISSLFRKKIAVLEIPKRVLYAQGSRILETDWQVKYLFGRYTAKASLTDGEGIVHTAVYHFWAFPWIEVVAFLVIIAILVLIVRTLKKKFKIIKR